jgi:CDP-diacylglycerol---glycerol-3-phosphate 3-phosphatidyltransferase
MITLLRILVIPIFVIIYFLPVNWAHPLASILFILAALTDWLDGYLARSLKQTTKLGAFLDPVADKLLIACAVVIVIGQHYMPGLSIAAAIIVMREIAISALREWMAEIGKRTSIAVTFVAKFKTFMQMVALVLLIWYTPQLSGNWVIWTGSILLFLSALLTLWTMAIYLKIAWPDLTLSQEKQ